MKYENSKQDLNQLFEENGFLSASLKNLNEGLNFLISKYRKNLSTDPPKQLSAKQQMEKQLRSSKVYQNEFDSNERLIKYLTLELDKLTADKITLEDPG